MKTNLSLPISILALIISALSLYYSRESFIYAYLFKPNLLEANVLGISSELHTDNLTIIIDLEIRNLGKQTNTIYFVPIYVKSDTTDSKPLSAGARRMNLIMKPGDVQILTVTGVFKIDELKRYVDIYDSKNTIGLGTSLLAEGKVINSFHDLAKGVIYPIEIQRSLGSFDLLSNN